jgi:hypothetical protein
MHLSGMTIPARLALRLHAVACLAVLASAAPIAQAAASGPTDQKRGPLLLADDEFWADLERTRDAVVAELAKSDVHGILLDAPKRVVLAGRDTLPVAGYFVRSLEDDRLLDQERQMVVVAVNQRSGQLLSGMALQSGKLPAPQAAPPRNPGKGTTLNMFSFDLRRTLQLPWTPGAYRVTVLLGRFISNTVVVELAGEGSAAVAAAASAATHIELVRAGKGNSGCKVSGRLVLDSPTPAAEVPANIVLLVTGLRTPGPWTVPQATARTDDEKLAATFGIDLTRSPELPRAPGSYFVYAFSSWGAAGPVQCRLDAKAVSRPR